MQNLLISPEEVIELAFSPHDQIDPAILTDTRIEAAQLKFLAPAFGTLYTALCEGSYADFCREYIKPAAAYFVKYHLFLHLSVRIGNDGIIRLNPPDSTPAGTSEIARLRRESRQAAYLLLGKAYAFLRDHASEFPKLGRGSTRHRRARISGGLVI